MARANLFADARRALAWSAMAKWLDVGGSALTFLVMVTLVGPETFGIYGMALVAVALPEAVVGGALSENIIQRQDLRPGHVTATFWLEMALAAALCGVMVLLTPHFVSVFHQPELKILVPAMGGALFLLAIGSAPAAQLQRALRFKAIAGVDAVGSITAAVVGLSLAALGFGVWSFLWMELARRTVRALGFAICARWLPSLRVRMRDVHDLTHFNLMTIATRLFSEADNALPRYIVGATLGANALGFYNVASRIFVQASSIIIAPFWAVALPVASSAHRDPDLLKSTLNSATRLTTLVAFPIFLGAAAIAPLAIPVLMGPGWTAAVPVVQLTMLNGIRSAAAPLTFGVLRGIGAAGVALGIIIASTLIGFIVTPLSAPWGLSAITFVLFLRGCGGWVAGAIAMKKRIGYPLWPQFFIGWRSLLAAMVMFAVVLLAQRFVPPGVSGYLALAGLVVLGAVTHAAALMLFWPALARRLGDIAVALARGDRAKVFGLLQMAANS